MATVSNSADIENQKILRALRVCETTDGTSILEDKIKEWALLKIVQELTAVHFALAQANLVKPQYSDWTKRQ
ncbi:MAG: hypothetical protein ACHQWV_06095 [Nitrospirales bacterium]